MRNSSAARRYRARPELDAMIEASGRRADWLATRAGISKHLLSHVVAGRRTLPEVPARVLAGLIGADFDALFELPVGTAFASDGSGGAGR